MKEELNISILKTFEFKEILQPEKFFRHPFDKFGNEEFLDILFDESLFVKNLGELKISNGIFYPEGKHRFDSSNDYYKYFGYNSELKNAHKLIHVPYSIEINKKIILSDTLFKKLQNSIKDTFKIFIKPRIYLYSYGFVQINFNFSFLFNEPQSNETIKCIVNELQNADFEFRITKCKKIKNNLFNLETFSTYLLNEITENFKRPKLDFKINPLADNYYIYMYKFKRDNFSLENNDNILNLAYVFFQDPNISNIRRDFLLNKIESVAGIYIFEHIMAENNSLINLLNINDYMKNNNASNKSDYRLKFQSTIFHKKLKYLYMFSLIHKIIFKKFANELNLLTRGYNALNRNQTIPDIRTLYGNNAITTIPFVFTSIIYMNQLRPCYKKIYHKFKKALNYKNEFKKAEMFVEKLSNIDVGNTMTQKALKVLKESLPFILKAIGV